MKLFCTSEKLMNTVEVALSDIVLDRRGPRRGTGGESVQRLLISCFYTFSRVLFFICMFLSSEHVSSLD
jgi:hypothetical protein